MGFWNQLIWIPDGITFILDTAGHHVEVWEIDRFITGTVQRREMGVEMLSPPTPQAVISLSLGPAPGAGVIAAVWHCGEYFTFLLSQGSFSSSFPASHCNLPQIKHVSNNVVSTVALRQCWYVCQRQKSNNVSSYNNEFLSTVWWKAVVMSAWWHWVAKVEVALSGVTSDWQKSGTVWHIKYVRFWRELIVFF